MKITITALVFTLMMVGIRCAKAQDFMGNPFTYATTTATYLTGEPNGTYTCPACSGVATVEVGALFIFTITNTDMVNGHTSRTQYSVQCGLGTNTIAWGNMLLTQANYGYYAAYIPAGLMYSSWTGTNMAIGSVPWASYYAGAGMEVNDVKTGDGWTFLLGNPPVVVYP